MTAHEAKAVMSAGPDNRHVSYGYCSCGWRGDVHQSHARAAADAAEHVMRVRQGCPHGDHYCPCNDGSVCNYEDAPRSKRAPCPRTGTLYCSCVEEAEAAT